ncbi:MAG: hypothetical protein N2738_00625 [Thermodesulfovibrionales bacterium]|nr:hypothetical protein [Thermodesulfovibrionales bacterium]
MNNKNDYCFELTADKLKLYKKLSPEERFIWLEEAFEFVSNAVSTDNLTRWKQYTKGESGASGQES